MDHAGNGEVALVACHLQNNGLARQHLADLELALRQLQGSSYWQCLESITLLRGVLSFIEHQGQHGFYEEETQIFAMVENKQPELRGLLEELRREHGVLRAVIEEFSREFAHFNATGILHRLPRVGQKLVHLFRRHLDREERELIPVILLNLNDKERRGLDHLFAGADLKSV